MATEWVMVRVRKTTRDRLEALRERLQRARDAGQLGHLDASDRFGVTLDRTVAELLRRDEAHASRSKRSIRGKSPLSRTEPAIDQNVTDGTSAAM